MISSSSVKNLNAPDLKKEIQNVIKKAKRGMNIPLYASFETHLPSIF